MEPMELGLGLTILGAAMATLLAGIGSAIGIGIAAQTAAGVITEDPDKFGLTLLLTALPGTQGIYGVVMSFMVMADLGLFAGDVAARTVPQGLYMLFAALPIAFVGFISAVYQGKAVSSGIQLIAKRPGEFVKAMTYAAMVETYAVFALLISLVMLMFSPF